DGKATADVEVRLDVNADSNLGGLDRFGRVVDQFWVDYDAGATGSLKRWARVAPVLEPGGRSPGRVCLAVRVATICACQPDARSSMIACMPISSRSPSIGDAGCSTTIMPNGSCWVC